MYNKLKLSDQMVLNDQFIWTLECMDISCKVFLICRLRSHVFNIRGNVPLVSLSIIHKWANTCSLIMLLLKVALLLCMSSALTSSISKPAFTADSRRAAIGSEKAFGSVILTGPLSPL